MHNSDIFMTLFDYKHSISFKVSITNQCEYMQKNSYIHHYNYFTIIEIRELQDIHAVRGLLHLLVLVTIEKN